MRRPSRLVLGLLIWLTVELAAFVVIAQAVGFGCALLLGLATSMAGLVLLRQAGNDAWAHLRAAIAGGAKPADLVEGLIGALAALLLILPGFVTDLIGLALAAPSVRQFLSRNYGHTGAPAARQRQHSQIVDLAPGDWASIDQPAAPPG